MSGQLVSPITLPPRRDSADRHPGGRTPLPVVEVETGPAKVPAVYTIAKLDGSGRVPAQSIVHAVGWAPGQTLTVTADGGAVILRRDPRGVFTLAASTHITIPGPLRTRFHLRAGDAVLLTAVVAHDTVLIYTMALLHQTLAERHVLLLDGDRR
jgi:bifunctional DNA-binding transcriptional regulator/antitoxin component of YhaV-PrlF toxin-antitoxin module